jgi:hypothetical protein
MNPFMASFTFLGLIYLLIALWAVMIGSMGSLAISAAGVLVCFLGWQLSNRLLQ